MSQDAQRERTRDAHGDLSGSRVRTQNAHGPPRLRARLTQNAHSFGPKTHTGPKRTRPGLARQGPNLHTVTGAADAFGPKTHTAQAAAHDWTQNAHGLGPKMHTARDGAIGPTMHTAMETLAPMPRAQTQEHAPTRVA